MTTAEKTELTTILSAARKYVTAYTGHVDETAVGEALTAENETTFTTKYAPIVSGTLKVYVNAAEVTSGFTVDYNNGAITFGSTPQATPTADYTAGIDAFEDFVIAVYVLCQDMYDNRSMYVDKTSMNRVVETILGMHSINLL
jgi:hypothetical protein